MKTHACALLLVLIFAATSSVSAQGTRKVTGRILFEGGEQPLAGALISVSGAKTGTCTGLTGAFTLDVPSNESVTLQITVPGWTGEAEVGAQQNDFVLQLERGVVQLPELVVSGQATAISKRNSANSIATVTGEQLTKVPAQTIETAMQGKVVGATIKQNSGAPGGGIQMQLRGLSSIMLSSDPLVIVDGVIISNAAIASGTHYITGVSAAQTNPVNRIADLNPNDVESIEVLKGASASAMYGMRGSNGVVIITTKHGKARTEQEAAPQPQQATFKCEPQQLKTSR